MRSSEIRPVSDSVGSLHSAVQTGRTESELFIEELLRLPVDPSPQPPLLDFSFGSKFHKEFMLEFCPKIAEMMPLNEQDLYCTRCGQHDDRWYAEYCAKCGKRLTGLGAQSTRAAI